MPTAHIYNYALNPDNLDRGVQTLRHSYDIVPTKPVETGNQRQLLMDRHIVASLNGCYRTVHQPRKHPDNPLISPTQPHEGTGPVPHGVVLRDPQTHLFRFWTPVNDPAMAQRRGNGPDTSRMIYYESDDGLTWRQPKLGLYELEGSSDNNIFFDPGLGRHDNLNVLPLPRRLHDRGRYAMLYSQGIKPELLETTPYQHKSSYRIAFSDDAIHWKDAPENPVLFGRSDSYNCLVYNDDRDVFMLYRRTTINAGEIRRIAYLESKDMVSWTQPIPAIDHDELDPLMHYAMPVCHYHGIYLGLLWCLHMHPHQEDTSLGNGKDFCMDTDLAWSRDGINWQRHPKRPTFIPTSPPYQGNCDWGTAVGQPNFIEMDDHVRIYYGGSETLHGPGVQSDAEAPHHLCLGTLRRDGFVSIDAGEDGGYMLTVPLAYPGGKLHINARTESDGFIRAAVREGEGVRDGEWPSKFRFDKSVPFTGDSLDHVLMWKDAQTLESFPSRTLRLHIWMEKAQLYSFWFGK